MQCTMAHRTPLPFPLLFLISVVMREIYALRYGELDNVVDGVVYATCEGDVRKTVSAAAKSNVLIIPYGGGTSVTGALEVPSKTELECGSKRRTSSQVCRVGAVHCEGPLIFLPRSNNTARGRNGSCRHEEWLFR